MDERIAADADCQRLLGALTDNQRALVLAVWDTTSETYGSVPLSGQGIYSSDGAAYRALRRPNVRAAVEAVKIAQDLMPPPPPPGTPEIVAKALRDLRPTERDILLAYTDPDSPTRGNKTQSALITGHSTTRASARGVGNEVLHRPRVVDALHTILDAQAAGYAVRSQAVIDIALNRTPQVTTTQQFDKSGKVVGKTVTEAPIPAATRLKALQDIARQTGEDAVVGARNRAISDTLLAAGRAKLRRYRTDSSTDTNSDD